MGKAKRKGLGGLSPEKKKMLKKLIMQKAAEDLKNEQKRKQEEKEKAVRSRIGKLDVDAKSDKGKIEKKVKELYQRVCALEEEKYDWEVKIRKQDIEINELTLKVNDIKGKFVKPVLKKVSKTESKLAKFEGKMGDKSKMGAFREQLKSTSKYAEEAPAEEAES